MTEMKRSAGVIMHIASLPGKFGIGTFGQEAYDYADFLYQKLEDFKSVEEFKNLIKQIGIPGNWNDLRATYRYNVDEKSYRAFGCCCRLHGKNE